MLIREYLLLLVSVILLCAVAATPSSPICVPGKFEHLFTNCMRTK